MPQRFTAPEGVRFTCSRCGDCCRTWSVMLGPGEKQAIEALDWSGHEEDLADVQAAVRVSLPGMPARHRLARQADGSCIFLGRENQCRIHEHFGAEAKPLMCRLYPFGFYPLGEHVAVDCSFSCRAVSENQGRLVVERVPEWARLLAETDDAGDKRSHLLTTKMPISGALIWELEHYLLGFLSNGDLSLFDRLRAMLQFMKLATTGDPTKPTAGVLRQAMAKGIPLQIRNRPCEETMDRTQRVLFFQWLFLSLNPPPFDLHQWSRAEQEKEKQRRIKLGSRFRDQQDPPLVDGKPLAATFTAIAAVDARPALEAEAEPLERFLRAKITGQKFLLAGEEELPLVEAVPKFLLAAPMALWTAKALAAEAGRAAVIAADLRRSLRLIDRTLGQVTTASLPRKQAEACDFIMLETDFVEAATRDLLRGEA